jgi:hypothetical protein
MEEAKLFLSSKVVDIKRLSYWRPAFPTFPVIDAIVWVPITKTVLYLQLTLAANHAVDLKKLANIHNWVKEAFQKSGNHN